MKTILLFDRVNWTHASVMRFLPNDELRRCMRIGWQHIIVICDSFDLESISSAPYEILVVKYSKEKDMALTNAYRISGTVTNLNLESILPQVEFDLRNFGFIPVGKKSYPDIYDELIRFPIHPKVDMLEHIQCRDILENNGIDQDIKKYLLDVFSIMAALSQITVSLQGEKDNFLKYYSTILSTAFLAKSKFEKLIFLVSRIQDENEDLYKAISNAQGHLKRIFLKNSKGIKNQLILDLIKIAEDFDHLDNQFRTPEAHKKGRLLSLICAGHFGSLMNELLAFDNRLNQFLQSVIADLRKSE